jgi:hypothetical protein
MNTYYCHQCGNIYTGRRETPPRCGCCDSMMTTRPLIEIQEEYTEEDETDER